MMSVIAGLRPGYVLIVDLIVGGGLTMGLVFLVNRSGALSTSEAVVQQYLARVYAQGLRARPDGSGP